MTRRSSVIRFAQVLLVVVIACVIGVANGFRSSPLDAPPRFTEPLPDSSPPAEMAMFQLPTGLTHRSAADAYRGGSFSDARDMTMTAVLVKHPRGDLLIDTGFGRHVEEHFKHTPLLFRLLTKYERGVPAAEQLRRAGYDGTRLGGIVITHAHWDHVSGVPDFPRVPVLLPRAERRFIDVGGDIVGLIRTFSDVRYAPYEFEGGAYLGFPRHHDVYGDGAIVIVPAPGHTPGSVVVFVSLPTGVRYAFVGDLVWQREAITEREEKPGLVAAMVDDDRAGVRENILRMAAIAARYPEIRIVPAHDARGLAGIPRLSAAAESSR